MRLQLFVMFATARLRLVQLDITDDKQIEDAYSFVESCVGSEGMYKILAVITRKLSKADEPSR